MTTDESIMTEMLGEFHGSFSCFEFFFSCKYPFCTANADRATNPTKERVDELGVQMFCIVVRSNTQLVHKAQEMIVTKVRSTNVNEAIRAIAVSVTATHTHTHIHPLNRIHTRTMPFNSFNYSLS